jgi:hypothetical protein
MMHGMMMMGGMLLHDTALLPSGVLSLAEAR